MKIRLLLLLLLYLFFLVSSICAQKVDDVGDVMGLDELLSLIHSDPSNEKIRLKAAQLYLDKGKKADAIELLKQGVYRNNNSFALHAKLCPLYLEINQPDQAIIHGTQALRLKPDSAQVTFNTGLAYAQKGLPRDALKLFHRAHQLSPENEDYIYNLAVAYFNLNDYDHSVQYYKKALEKDPKDARAYFNLGTIYNILGRKEDAITQLRKALDILGPFTDEGKKTIEYIDQIRQSPY